MWNDCISWKQKYNFQLRMEILLQTKIYYLCSENQHNMKKYFFFIIASLILGFYSNARQQEVPYTLADRDRLIQVEANVNGLRNEMNSLRNEIDARFEALDMRFNAMESKIDSIFWILGVVVALIIFMLGFIIWDRRTTLAPVKYEIEELKQANEKVKDIFRKQAESQPKLIEILKNAGIL